jgi:hypothetical protein
MSQETQCLIAVMQLTTVSVVASWLGYILCDYYVNPLSKKIRCLQEELEQKNQELLSLRKKVDQFVCSLIENESDSDDTDSVVSDESDNQCPHY